MPKLSNNKKRADSMIEFLTKTGMDGKKFNVFSTEGLYAFSCNDPKNPGNIEQLANHFAQLLTKDNEHANIKKLTLLDVIDYNLKKSESQDPLATMHLQACESIFKIIANTPSQFIEDTGMLHIQLPNPVYASILSLLNYPFMSFDTNGFMFIDLRAQLATMSDDIILVEGCGKDKTAVLFVNSSRIENNRVLFSKKDIGNNQYQVTPYFFVPSTGVAPKYYFLLDVSGSMRATLPKVIDNVFKLATNLFEFQPNAQLEFSTFSQLNIKDCGIFQKKDLGLFKSTLNKLSAEGNTPLYPVTLKMIKKISQDKGFNNALLYTDGKDSNNFNEESEIKVELSKVSDSTKARNKFYVFRCGTYIDDTMPKVSKCFNSEHISTESNEFKEASGDSETMKNWAAKRDLFKTRFVVSNQKEPEVVTSALNQSGQIEQLKPHILNKGESLEIQVEDGDGKIVLKDSICVGGTKRHSLGLFSNDINKTDDSDVEIFSFNKH